MGRSQRHLREIRGLDSGGNDQGDLNDVYAPAITAINPSAKTIARATTVNTTLDTFSVVGGTAPITYTIPDAAGCSVAFTGNLLKNTANPIHATTGAKTLSIRATDKWGKTLAEPYVLTLT